MASYFEPKGRKYLQVQSLRDITKTNFPNGQIRFNFSIPAQESWNPYLSFFNLRCDFSHVYKKLTEADGVGVRLPINPAMQVAPAMYFGDSLWQQIEFQINGMTVNKQDNYIHQIAALKHRFLSQGYNDTYKKLCFPESDARDRANYFGVGGVGDQAVKVVPGDLFDDIGNLNVRIPNVAAGGPATLTLESLSPLENWFKIGDIIHVVFDGGVTTEGPITALQDDDLTFTSRAAGGLNNALAAPLTAGKIFYAGKPMRIADANAQYKELELIWKPALGIFDLNQWLPGGDYEIILTPFPASSYRKNAIEVYPGNFSKYIADVDFYVNNMEFNICCCSSPADIKQLVFNEMRCQAKTLNTASLSQKQYNIHPNIHALTIALQDNRVQSDFRVPASKFKIYTEDFSDLDWELKLSRFFVQYDGDVLPNPIPDIRKNSTQDFMFQRYWETQHYKMMAWDDIESYEEWKAKGPYYHFQWPRKNKGATEIQVSIEFSEAALPTNINPQLLLFEHYMCKYSLSLSQGYITGVQKIQ